MIAEPKSFTEQMLNFVERVATEMKALLATISTKSDIGHTHAQSDVTGLTSDYSLKSETAVVAQNVLDIVNNTNKLYATPTELSEGLAGKLDVNGKAVSAATADKATTADSATAATTAETATKAENDANGKPIVNTYATKTELAAKQDKGDYITSGTAASTYMTKTDANATFVKTVNGTAPTNGNVAINDYVTSLSIRGKTITVKKKNGTSSTLTTQDTTYTHPKSGVTAGTYNKVTVNANGHVTAGSNESYAAASHTHSGYAASNHTHSGYAASNHTHSEYASSSHTHSYLPLSGGTCTGTVKAPSFQISSDARLKSNFAAVDGALDKVAAISAFAYNKVGFDGRQVGVIAQDVEKVLPEAVSESDGFKTVDYSALTALLINAVNELRSEVRALN